MRLYINVAYSVPFRFPASSIVGLGLGLVVGIGSVLYVKRRKISITASWSGGSVVECLHMGRAVRVRIPVPTIIFQFFVQVFSQVFCKLGLVLFFDFADSFLTLLTLLTVRTTCNDRAHAHGQQYITRTYGHACARSITPC